MKLIINGEEVIVENKNTLQQIMENLEIIDKVMACAVNMNIVKKEQWTIFIPEENDKIELLQFVGGG